MTQKAETVLKTGDRPRLSPEKEFTFRVPHSTQTDANREFKTARHTSYQWFVTALIVFTIIDYVYLYLLKLKA
jgi:hypothetical protein